MTGFEDLLRTNVVGVWLAMKHCVEPMKQRGGGSMIATASIAGLIGFPGIAPYCATKHAVCGLVKTAALELGESENSRQRDRPRAHRQPHDAFRSLSKCHQKIPMLCATGSKQ